MNDIYIENSKRIMEIIRERPWLFPEGREYAEIGLYIQEFERLNGKEFFMYPTMLPYTIELLDKYSEDVYNTIFLPTGQGNLSMHTILQLSKSLHIFLMWGISSDNRETTLYCTVYTTNPPDFPKFLLTNEKLMYEGKSGAGFFGNPQMV